jgi:hypothetical protein
MAKWEKKERELRTWLIEEGLRNKTLMPIVWEDGETGKRTQEVFDLRTMSVFSRGEVGKAISETQVDQLLQGTETAARKRGTVEEESHLETRRSERIRSNKKKNVCI